MIVKIDNRWGRLTMKALVRVNLATVYLADNTKPEWLKVTKSSESLLRFWSLIVNTIGAEKSQMILSNDG